MSNEVSIYLSAKSPENAREVFEQCMAIVATGKLVESELVLGDSGEGAAHLYTWEPKKIGEQNVETP